MYQYSLSLWNMTRKGPHKKTMWLLFQGKGLYAKAQFKEGAVILTETPLVCAQFSWNELYKYAACQFCLRSLETAQDMSRRLSDHPALVLPHPECCEVDTSSHTCCPHCQVQWAGDVYRYMTSPLHTLTHVLIARCIGQEMCTNIYIYIYTDPVRTLTDASLPGALGKRYVPICTGPVHTLTHVLIARCNGQEMCTNV